MFLLFRPAASLRRTFTLTLDRCPLCPMDPLSSQASASHMRRELRVDMRELVYSFARGMWKIKSYPADWQRSKQPC